MIEDIENFIPFLLFFTLFIFNYRAVGRLIALSNFIILLYTISMLSFFILTTIYNVDYYYNIYGLLLIFIPICFMVMPLRKFEKQSNNCKLEVINPRKLKIFAYFVTIICLYAIFFFSLNLTQVMAVGVVDMRNGQDALYESSIFSKLAVLGAFLSPTALFLYFYNQVHKQFGKFFVRIIFVGSFSFVFYTLNVAGRDGIIIWILTYLSCLCIFYKQLPRKVAKKNIYTIIGVILLMLPIFLFISNERFDSSDLGTGVSMIDYLGKQLGMLSENIDFYLKTDIGNISPFGPFALLSSILLVLGISTGRSENTFDAIDMLFNVGYANANQFSFFVGSFFPIYTSLFVLIVFIAICIMVYKSNLRLYNGIISTRHLICAFIWFMIPIVGIFYFYYGTLIGNVFLMLPFFVKMYLK